MEKHLLQFEGHWLALSYFHGVGVSGPVQSVCRPQDVTYILKAMTNSFQIWIFPKCPLFILKCIRLKHFLSFASFLIAEWLQLTVIVVVDFGPNANSVA